MWQVEISLWTSCKCTCNIIGFKCNTDVCSILLHPLQYPWVMPCSLHRTHCQHSNVLSIACICSVVNILSGLLIVQENMALTFNNKHVIHYHMDAQQPTGLALTYFASPDYLAVQDWIHSTFLSSDTINLTKPLYIIILRFLREWWEHTFVHPLYLTHGCNQLF